MNRSWMYARADRGGTYYWEDIENKQQHSLKTKDRRQAVKLLHAKNETVRQASDLHQRRVADKGENGRQRMFRA